MSAPNIAELQRIMDKPASALTRKPVIGLCVANPDSESARSMKAKLEGPEGELAKVEVFKDSDNRDAAKDLANVDAVVVMGDNDDINPARYGQPNLSPSGYKIADDKRIDYRMAMINGAMDQDIPLLGVCAGMQAINVARHEQDKGTLIQHVPEVVGNESHYDPDGRKTPVMPVTILPGGTLSQIGHGMKTIYSPSQAAIPGMNIHTNAIHHQAVNKVRDGFRMSAISGDGIVMAIEPDPNGKYAGKSVIGVQWHPEFLDNDLSKHLIRHMVDLAKERAILRSMEDSPSHDVRIVEKPPVINNNPSWIRRIAERVGNPTRGYSRAQ